MTLAYQNTSYYSTINFSVKNCQKSFHHLGYIEGSMQDKVI